MDVEGGTVAAGLAGGGMLGLGWWYLRSQLGKIDDLRDKVIRLETLQDEKVRECQQHKLDVDARLNEGKAEFASMRTELKEVNNKLTQLLVIFRERYSHPNDTQTLPHIPLDTHS